MGRTRSSAVTAAALVRFLLLYQGGGRSGGRGASLATPDRLSDADSMGTGQRQ